MVIPNLSKLIRIPYVHQYFVDGPISIADIDYSGTIKTILVGSLGAGGAGLFALDITSPTAATESAAAAKVKWEITASGDFANLGHVYGSAQFSRLSNGTAAIFVGNGYMNEGNGNAVLYIINADTGALISEIDTGSGSGASPNGLSTPALYDADQDGRADYVYAGDIDGNLWKFDLSNNSSELIMTTDGPQAITTAPAVDAHPLGGTMVVFATGRVLTSGDKEDLSVHYVYGIWDGAPDANDAFLTQTLYSSTFNGTGRVRNITANTPDWTEGLGNHKGWKIALPAGERVVGETPFRKNGRFYFLSTNPTIEGYENWLHEPVFMTGGSPPGPIFDLSDDGNWDADDLDDDGLVPVAKYLGTGAFAQPRLVNALDIATTLYAYHPDQPVADDGVPTPPDDPGVSGGHFDYDIYYYDMSIDDGSGSLPPTTIIREPDLDDFIIVTTSTISDPNKLCLKPSDAASRLDSEWNKCEEDPRAGTDYVWVSDYEVGAVCDPDNDPAKVKNFLTLTCNSVVEREVIITMEPDPNDFIIVTKDTVGDPNKVCEKPSEAENRLNTDWNKCAEDLRWNNDYVWFTAYSVGEICQDDNDPAKVKNWLSLTCNRLVQIIEDPSTDPLPITIVYGSYKNKQHEHEYDDKFDVTGVNMLNASQTDFNLINALPDSTLDFKILVMNQYLNPASLLAVGPGAEYESVQTYGGMASETSAETVLDNQPVYNRANIGIFTFNLPLDAFASKDWWGDGVQTRAGLIPTQTGCVNGVNDDGTMKDLKSPNGERYNGSLTFQLIRPETPPGHLTLAGPDVTYGWKVRDEFFRDYVLAEYTAFWHHPNGECFGEPDWIPDPAQDWDAGSFGPGAPGSDDPRDGVFGSGLGVVSNTVTVDADTNTTTQTVIYSDGTEYKQIVITNDNGTITTITFFRDNDTDVPSEIVTTGADASDGGRAGYVDPLTGSPEEDLSTGKIGRQSWRDLLD